MNTELLLQITSFLIVFVSFLLAFFLFTVKSKNKIGNIFLSLYLIIKAVDFSSYFYYKFIDLPNELELLRRDIGSFLGMPILYLFVLSIIYSDFKIKRAYLIHLSPFLLITIIQLPLFYLADIDTQNQFADGYLYDSIGVFSTTLAHLQKLLYICLIFYLLYKYKKILLENYSISNDYNHKWLMQMTIFISVLFVIAIIKNTQKYGNSNAYLLSFRLSVTFGMLMFTCWLVLKALYAPKIFTGVNSKLKLNRNNKTSQKHINLSKLKLAEKLNLYMVEHQPFLNPDFTIQQLAHETEIDTREISSIINHHLNQNFYEFVNQYRIEEAKKVLLKNRDLTILEVLYSVGFNSKSTFNTQFKKTTQHTPTEYRIKNS